MASLNKRDKIWLWVVGLASFAAFVMLLLFLIPGVYKLRLIFCEAQSTNGDKKPGISCCRQTRDSCEGTEQKPTCGETKPRDEITFNPGNNPQVDRLIRAIEGLERQQLVIKQQGPDSLKLNLEGNPQVERLINAVKELRSLPLAVEQQKPHSLKLELENNPQVDRLIRAVETRSPQYPVTEQRLTSYLAEKTACDNAGLDMSDFILFGRTKFQLEGAAKGQVAEFMKRNGQIKKLWVFGFASPDGEDGRNKGLAKVRAKAVRNEIKTGHSYSGDIAVKPIGEDHPINGIANSRSVVIAACWATPGEAETAGKPDTTPSSCIDTSRSD